MKLPTNRWWVSGPGDMTNFPLFSLYRGWLGVYIDPSLNLHMKNFQPREEQLFKPMPAEINSETSRA
jgi:hypothetical protein